MLLDKPLTALDAELHRQMQDFLRAQQRRGSITFLFVPHDQQEAIRISDQISVMSKGSVEQVATPQELHYRPQTPFVADFFGDNKVIEGTASFKTRILTSFGEFEALNPNGCTFGVSAKLALRPGVIFVKSRQQKAAMDLNSVTAVIQDVEFFRAGTSITARSGDRTVFADSTAGYFDGLRTETEGCIWTSAADGVHCFEPNGTFIGKTHVPEVVANFCFGGSKRNYLFVCGSKSLYGARLPVNGDKTF
jgi:ABC-type Fe3+/spermidine/putrescine transport system ATPase subunit